MQQEYIPELTKAAEAAGLPRTCPRTAMHTTLLNPSLRHCWFHAPATMQEYIPELTKAAEAAGLDWSQFKLTDNSCKDHPVRPKGTVQVLEEELEDSLK